MPDDQQTRIVWEKEMGGRRELQKAREHPAVASPALANGGPAPAQLWRWSLGWGKAFGCIGPRP